MIVFDYVLAEVGHLAEHCDKLARLHADFTVGRHHPGIIHKLLLLALVPALVVTVAGCGTSAQSVEFAPPQVIEVGTHELDGRNGVGFTLEVRRLRLTRSGWEVAARVVNSTPVSWLIVRPHELGLGTKFGLFVASKPNALRPMALEAEHLTTPQLLAARFDPPIPSSSNRPRAGAVDSRARAAYVVATTSSSRSVAS